MTDNAIAIAAVRALLGSRVVAYSPLLARILGGVKEAICFAQLCYWSERLADESGEFWRRVKDFEDDTGLTKFEQQSARAHLCAAGVLEARQAGIPKRWHYRINWPRTLEMLSQWEEKPPTSGRENLPTYGGESSQLRDLKRDSIREEGGAQRTRSAPRPPKPRTARDPLLDHPAVRAYRDIAHLTPPHAVRPLIADTVGPDAGRLALWSDVVRRWIALGYRPQNIGGMLDVLQNGWSPPGTAVSRSPAGSAEPEPLREVNP